VIKHFLLGSRVLLINPPVIESQPLSLHPAGRRRNHGARSAVDGTRRTHPLLRRSANYPTTTAVSDAPQADPFQSIDCLTNNNKNNNNKDHESPPAYDSDCDASFASAADDDDPPAQQTLPPPLNPLQCPICDKILCKSLGSLVKNTSKTNFTNINLKQLATFSNLVQTFQMSPVSNRTPRNRRTV
jgi:hypothetical protein